MSKGIMKPVPNEEKGEENEKENGESSNTESVVPDINGKHGD